MHGRNIEPTKSAYRFPLLIKQLLLAAMRNHADQEIVYRDLRRIRRCVKLTAMSERTIERAAFLECMTDVQ